MLVGESAVWGLKFSMAKKLPVVEKPIGGDASWGTDLKNSTTWPTIFSNFVGGTTLTPFSALNDLK